jgi:hydroxyacylglutathione hydrolase
VCLVELDDHVVLIDIPAFRADSFEFIRSFRKPIECIATHGPTVIGDSARWQKELGVKVSLHAADQDDEWIGATPDILFRHERYAVGRLEVIHTPGHSQGSVCILDSMTKALFTGDTVAATKAGSIRDIRGGSSHDADSKERYRSVERLSREQFDSILPFHYSPLLHEARKELLEYLNG